jgi:hypothetical protein
MEKLIGVLLFPIIALNAIGGVVGGIWLLIDGHWQIPVSGLALLFLGPIVLGIAMLPNMLLVGLSVTLMERVFILGFLVAMVSCAYIYVLMAAWEYGAFYYVALHYEGGSEIPYVLSAYAIATGVWQYMASKEQGSGGSEIATLALCVSAFFMLVMWLVKPEIVFSTAIAIVAAPFVLGWVVQCSVAFGARSATGGL